MGWWRKRKKKQILKTGAKLLEDLIECCDGKSNPIKYFSADEIRKATDNFSNSNQLLKSSYKWYSGKSKNHDMLLIKKGVDRLNVFEERNFCRDIAVSSMVSGQRNFLKLVGCCLEFNYPVMVYSGVKKHYGLGDLSEQSWQGRMKIVEDIATALAYLHSAFPRPFIYRNMSIGNILLDEDGIAKLSDFSCCVLIPKGETFVKVESIAGTYGYMEGKYIMSGIVSEKTDVFAIGRIMQNLLMGQDRFYHGLLNVEDAKEASDSERDDDDDDTNDSGTMSAIYDPFGKFQSRLLKCMEEGGMDKIVDPEMVANMGEISEEEICQMKAFGMLSLRCVRRGEEVATMVEVAKELKKIQRSLRNDSSSSPSVETPFYSFSRGEVPTIVEEAKELKKIQRSLRNDSSSSPSVQTPFNSTQDISSSVLIGRGEVPTIVEEAKEPKKIQRSLNHDSSSSPSSETPLDSTQDSSSSVVLSNQTLSTKALVTSITYQVLLEIFQWVMLNWFRFFRKNRRMC